MRSKVMEKIKANKIIAIARSVDGGICLRLADALYEGGVRFWN